MSGIVLEKQNDAVLGEEKGQRSKKADEVFRAWWENTLPCYVRHVALLLLFLLFLQR